MHGVLVSFLSCSVSYEWSFDRLRIRMLVVKIDGNCRFIDCYLASPFLPSNKGFIESHWFLARPLTMIYTHFPASFQDQFLDPPISASIFFSLPHVRTPFFKHHLQVLDYDFTFLDLIDDDGMCIRSCEFIVITEFC
jgi:transglutaminase/protease-like cytokinesis protein 3